MGIITNITNIASKQNMKNFTVGIHLFLAGSGWAQFGLNLNNCLNLGQLFGRIREASQTDQVSACPPLVGDPTPPGCNKTFVLDSDGGIPCWDNTDCPEPGTCENNICNLFIPRKDCPRPPCRGSLGRIISFTSPTSGQTTETNSCSHCSKTTCPPSRPCRRGEKCYRPTCNRRGRCWCRK